MHADPRITRILILVFSLWLVASSTMPGANGLAAGPFKGEAISQLLETAGSRVPLLTEVATPAQQNLPPGNLPPGDMQAIFAQIQAEEYFVSWDEHTALPELPAAYQAPNRAGNFRTYFSGEGVVIVPRQVTDGEALPWRWGISLAGWRARR
jgi:hypothetical protein